MGIAKKNLGIVKEIGLSVYELSEIKTEWIDYLTQYKFRCRYMIEEQKIIPTKGIG